LRFTGPASQKLARKRNGPASTASDNGRLQIVPDTSPFASLTVTKLCDPLARPSLNTFLDRRSWRARLKPGAYVASVTFSWHGKSGNTEETGIVGLLVSRAQALRVLPQPRCR
jgi:hypothetical protein